MTHPFIAWTEQAREMLDTQPALGLVAPWLSLRELWYVRAVNRKCFAILPRQTWRLEAADLGAPDALVHALAFFPNARQIALREIKMPPAALHAALTHFSQWTLTQLELSQVWHLSDAHLRELTAQCPLLQRLTVRQCYLLKTPTIVGPRLTYMGVHNCLVSHFHPDTTWPMLQELHVSSRALTTVHARHLLKELLARSSIRVLDLSDCFLVEQVLIDPGDMPLLERIYLRSCLGLKRVHIASHSLTVLDLALCVELEVVVLDLQRVHSLDLSYLQHMTHLFLRSSSLGLLDLRACSVLTPQHLRVHCPSITAVDLQGTKNITIADLQRQETEYQ